MSIVAFWTNELIFLWYFRLAVMRASRLDLGVPWPPKPRLILIRFAGRPSMPP